MSETVAERFAQPTPVDNVTLASPASVSDLLPPYDDQLREWAHSEQGRRWTRVQRDWFFSGLPNAQFHPVEGVDPKAAVRHLKACQGSFEPKHEHKEAGVAYLMSLWFTDVTYDKPQRP